MSDPASLKLLALDAEDLAVISAHLQDAVLRVGDLAYLPRDKRFACVLNRFNWLGALLAGATPANERYRTGLRFEQVERARVHGIDLKARDRVLSLLAITFAPVAEGEPRGRVQLHFSGDAAIELEVACVEAELKDLGAAWRAGHKPHHPLDESEV